MAEATQADQPEKEEVENKQVENEEEKKEDYPDVFGTKCNTDAIDWNALHHLAITKGKMLAVQRIIQKEYAEQLKDYDVEKKNTPNIPDLSKEIIEFIEHVLCETALLMDCHKTLMSHENWETQVDGSVAKNKCISVYYRAEDNDIHSIKVSYTSKCDPLHLIAVINEFDLMSEVVTIAPVETKYLKEFTVLDKAIYAKLKMWWPLKDRDVICHVHGYDLLEEYDEILIWGKSHEEIKGVDIPKCDKKTVRISVVMASGAIKPKMMDDGTVGTEVTAIFNVDFNSFLPQTLLNWINRTFAYYGCSMIRDRTEKLEGTKHEQRIKEKQMYKDWADEFVIWKKAKMDQMADEEAKKAQTDDKK